MLNQKDLLPDCLLDEDGNIPESYQLDVPPVPFMDTQLLCSGSVGLSEFQVENIASRWMEWTSSAVRGEEFVAESKKTGKVGGVTADVFAFSELVRYSELCNLDYVVVMPALIRFFAGKLSKEKALQYEELVQKMVGDDENDTLIVGYFVNGIVRRGLSQKNVSETGLVGMTWD